jgi:flagellar protein FlbD
MLTAMIELHRLNSKPVIVSALHILTVEETPDTLLTLINGEKIFVKDSVDDVVQLATQYYTAIGRPPPVVAAKKSENHPWT